MRIRLLLGVASLLVAGAAYFYLRNEGPANIAIGEPAPDFTATNLTTGKSVSLSKEYQGQVTLVNLWATWCGPCRQEIPALQKLYQALSAKGLRIAAVSIDTLPADSVMAFMQKYGVTFDVLHDPKGLVQAAYRTEKFPESFLLDREGRFFRIDYGAKEWASEDLIKQVSLLLDQPVK